MSEVYGWPEGALHIWTGSHTASGQPVAFVRNVNVSTNYRWQWDAAVDGSYNPHLVGKQGQMSVGQAFVHGSTLQALNDAQTAVHFKIINSGVNGSAGIFLYSGRLDGVTLQGAEGGVFDYSLRAQAYVWSAF